MTNREIRRKILEILYESFKDHPYGRITPKELQKTLNISLKELQFNAIYLEEKGLIELQKPLEGSLFVGARATPKGIDIVEDGYELDMLFSSDTAGNVIPPAVFHDIAALQQAVKVRSDLSDQQKEIINEEIQEVANEFKKPEPSYAKVKNTLDRLKQRNINIHDELKNIIRDPVVTRILGLAARKELGI